MSTCKDIMRNIAKKRNQIFIGIMFVSLFLWIACILLQGTDSRFYNVFFGRTGNFLADCLNTIGFTKDKNPYFDTSIEPCEHSYPPLAYLIFYAFHNIVIQYILLLQLWCF